MINRFVGIDCGSTMCKTVLFDGEHIIDCHLTKTGWNPAGTARESLSNLLTKHSLSQNDVRICVTGYGREAVDFSDYTFTEITCHALGALLLLPEIGGVIDVGGQDSKVIQVQGGKVVEFLMNDKCAAGTGRFLSMACDALGIALEEIDGFANPHEVISITSMCTVFAESEIIGTLAMQKDRSKILSGVLLSIAQKILQMAGKLDFNKDKPLIMTGGLSRSTALVGVISKTIGIEVVTHELAQFAGAVGACISAKAKEAQCG